MTDKHREGLGSVRDKLFSDFCALFLRKSYICLFFSLQLSQPWFEGSVVEANTSVLGPFANICFALCQLACAVAARVRPVPWAPYYYFAPLENQTEGYHFEHTKSEAHSATWHSKKETAHLLYS